MVTDIISVLALLFSLSGNVLVNLKKRFGYVLWFISNILWIVVNFIDHFNLSQVIMYLAYVALNVWGFIAWSKTNRKVG